MSAIVATHNNAAASTIKGGAGGNGTALLSGDRQFTIQSGDGLKFPTQASYALTLGNPAAGNAEIVHVTARTGDTFQMARGREGTQAQQWPVGTAVALRIYAESGDLFGVGPIANGVFTSLGNSAQALAAAGTIATSGLGVSRVTPGASCTGVVLQAGTQDGQQVTVENTHASNSVTFAAAGTSQVADGASDVIPALTGRTFVWDATGGLWYRLA